MNVSLFWSSPPSAPVHPESARPLVPAADHVLDAMPEDSSFDRVMSLAARVLRAPVALVCLADRHHRRWVASAVGTGDATAAYREFSLGAHAPGSDELLVVPDATLDPRFQTDPLVTGAPHVRFYAGAPLLAPPPRPRMADPRLPQPGEATRLGTLCVMDTVARPAGLRPDERESLRDLAAMAVETLQHRLAAEHHRDEAAGRERAEAGWRLSEERHERLANNRLGVVYQFALAPDGSSSFTLIGEGCRDLLGVSPAAARRDARAIFQLVHPEDLAPLRVSMVRCADGLEPWRWEGRVRLADDGAVKWLAATSWPQRQPDGTILWDGILTDVTARHAAEEALREVNRQLEARVTERTAALGAEIAERRRAEEAARESRDLATILVENATDLVFVEDLRGRFLLANPAFVRACGRRVEDLVGQDSRSFYDAATAERMAAFGRDVVVGGTALTREIPMVFADGHPARCFQIALTPLRDHAGRVAGLVGIARDTTERQQAERRVQERARQQAAVAHLGRRALELNHENGLESLLREATDLVARTLEVPFSAVIERDPEDGAMRYRAVFGWSAEVVGQPIASSGRDDSGPSYLLRHGGAIVSADLDAETRFQPSPESRQWGLRAAMSVVVARRTDGPADGEAAFFGVLTVHDRQVRPWTTEDVSFLQAMANVLAAAVDRRRAEEAVVAARREAERANRAKSEFLSRMSHELRTPLNAILGFGQLLELDADTVAQRESVEHILKGGRHLLGLIDEVLDISRIETGRLELETTPVVVGPVLEEAVALVRHAAKGRAVDIDLPGGMPGSIRVWADPMRLRQVLVNLLSNAVKYNVPGGRVGLRVSPSPAGGGGGSTVRLEVWDTGRGIPVEQHGRLFTPFERLGAEHGAVEGTGIGLVIVKRLVQAMGGTIGVRSAAGEGSTFWVDLPAGDEEENRQAA